MKKKLHRITKGVLFCFLLVMLGCENDKTVSDQDSELVKAREWFENQNQNLEALSFTKKIDWDNAIITNGERGLAIEVPLLLIDNTSTNVVEDKEYKTHMRLLLLADTENIYKVYNIVFTTKNEIFDNTKKEQNFYHIDEQYSGYITLQDNNSNKIIYSGEYKDGTLIGLHNANVESNETSRFRCRYWVYVGPTVTCSSWDWETDYSGSGFGGPPGISGPFGGPPVFQNQIDPCNTAKKLTTDSKNAAYLSAKNSILDADPEVEHSITLGKEVTSGTIQGPPKGGGAPIGTPPTTTITKAPMNNGGTNGVKTTTNWPGAFAALHNHPNGTPLSSGDIYAAVTLNKNNSNFTTSYILTGGETYAIVVTDLTAAQAFVAAYPPDLSPLYPPEFPDFIFNQITDARSQFGESNEARTMGIASVLDNNNAGIALMKQDSNGDFKPLKIKETTNSNGSKTYSLMPCN